MSRPGVGIIGTGWGARVQVPAFRAAGLEVVALAGSQATKTQQIAADLGVAWATGAWRALLERPDVALVSIVTPPNLHREMAVAALEAGKHALCEKPTAMDATEAQAMLAAARARPAQMALIDHELRFLPVFREARRLVAEGAIGQVRSAEVRTVVSSRADRQRPWNWWSDAAQGGGALGAIGSHQVDQLRYLLADEVAAARGFVHTFVAERPTGAPGATAPVTSDDFTAFHLRFQGGSAALAVANLVARSDEPGSVTLYGDAGTLRISGGRLLLAAPGAEPQDLTPPHAVSFPAGISGDFPEATVYLGQALRAALDGDRAAVAPAATFADGLRVQQALDAVRRSQDAGWVALPG